MKIRNALVTYSALIAALGAGTALAQGNEDLEITISLLPEQAQASEAATRTLSLPVDLNDDGDPRPSEQGQLHGGEGLDTANAAREAGRANAVAAVEAAQESREEFGRGHMPDPEDLPGSAPEDRTGPPDTLPGPPESPPGAP